MLGWANGSVIDIDFGVVSWLVLVTGLNDFSEQLGDSEDSYKEGFPKRASLAMRYPRRISQPEPGNYDKYWHLGHGFCLKLTYFIQNRCADAQC